MAHTKKSIAGNVNNGSVNTFSYSGSFDVFKASEVEVELDNVALTFTTSTINESASPREYTVDFTNKTVHIGGADLASTDQVVIQPVTDMGSPTPRATYTPGASITAADLNNNQLQLLRKAMEDDEQKLSSRGGTMTGNLHMGEDVNLSFEGATDNTYETTLTVADPTADRTITFPDTTGTVITTGDTGTVATGMIANDAINSDKIANDVINSEHYVASSIDTEHYASGSVDATALGSNAVITAKINNLAVTTGKIADDAVTADKLAHTSVTPGSYTAVDLTVDQQGRITAASTGTIAGSEIEADAIDGTKIADDSINSEHYVNGSIDHVHLANDIVDGDNIADTSINSEHYVDGSIDHSHLANDIIDGDNIQDDVVNSEHIAAGALDNEHYATGSITSDKLDGATVVTSSEQASATANDTSFFTSAAAEAAFLRQDSSETIASGVTWSGTDSKVATTAAIDLRIIDLVDDVGGFVPIANETSFPTANPDVNNGTGTIVSVKTASTTLTPSGTTVTIANGAGTGNTVTITGVSSAIPSGYGFLIETTTTLHTYTFHRLTPKATEVATVAANATAIAAAGNNVTDINNFVDLYQISISAPTARADTSSLQVGDLWYDSSSNKVLMIYDGSSGDGFTAATPNASDLTNINIVAGQLVYTEDLGLITNAVNTGSGNNSINTVATDIANVNSVAGSISNVNAVAADATDIGAVAAKATEIGRLGTADAVADMNTLGTTAIVSDLDTLADISSNITTVAGISGNVTTVAGISSNVTAVAGNATNINAVAGDATDIGAVAGKATEIGRLGTADAVADLAILGTTDVVADMNTLATTAIVSDMDTLADISSNISTVAGISGNVTTVAGNNANVTTVAGNNANVTTVAGISANVTTVAGIQANVTTVANNNSNVTTVAGSISDVNTFANRYRIASSNPTSSLDVGDLYFNTSSNELRVYNGSAWQGGVTATGSLAGLTANTFSDNQTINANIIVSGTVDGRDVAADGTKLDGIEASATADQTASEIVALISGQTIAPNVITTTNLTLDFGSIA